MLTFKRKTNLEEDEAEYLEIKEDLIKAREEKAQSIIQKYCKKYQLMNGIEVHQHPVVRDRIIKELIIKSKLSLTRIAELTGMSYSSVQYLSKKIGI